MTDKESYKDWQARTGRERNRLVELEKKVAPCGSLEHMDILDASLLRHYRGEWPAIALEFHFVRLGAQIAALRPEGKEAS